jgi:CRP-like cAMP-binding protein
LRAEAPRPNLKADKKPERNVSRVRKLDDSLIASVPPFRLLSGEQRREVLDLATGRLVEVGKTVFDQGYPATHFHLMLDGHIRVLKQTKDGDQVVMLHISPGQLIGIAAAIGLDTYPATAVAASDCVMLSWPMSLWARFAADYPGFATETYKVVGGRFGAMQDVILEMATKHVEQRVACALLRLLQQGGHDTEAGLEVDFPVTRQVISEMTGTTLHTVSRLMSAWEKDGILDSQRQCIRILDPHRLVVISEQ